MAETDSAPSATPTRRSLYSRLRRRGRLEFMRLHEQMLDAALGIRAYAPMARRIDPNDRNQPYEPMSYFGLDRISRALKLGSSDVIYDIGCGMGRVTCYFARQQIAGSIGVELDEGLARIGQQNARTLRGRKAPIAIHAADATEHSYADGTVFLLYNPFGPEVWRAVLDQINRDRRGRPIRIVYGHPVQAAVLDATPWLRRAGEPFHIPHYHVWPKVQMWESVQD
jgi:SAM-dependent methyltransferase